MKSAFKPLIYIGTVLLSIPVLAQGQEETALISDLVTANRVLASDSHGVLGVYGHVSVRSRVNPESFYISRNVAPALVTADQIVHMDLDGNAIGETTNDYYEERFIDAAIYRARPDVMSVVHTHAPELIAFSISSTPLPLNERTDAPVFDVRRFNDGKVREIVNSELGEILADQLAGGDTILLLGHGAVTVASSLPQAISSASRLQRSALLQTQMIAMGGEIIENPRGIQLPREQPSTQIDEIPSRPPEDRELDIRNNATDRAWDHWRRVGPLLVENSPPLVTNPRPSDPVEAIKRDLVIASRILSDPRLNIFDTAGHISVRNPQDPNRYFISRAVSPAAVSLDGLIENDLDSNLINGPRDFDYIEEHIHGQIYKARPDVMAVIHSHTLELVAFGQTTVDLRPVSIDGAFIGDGLPLWTVGRYDPTQSLVSTPELGASLAETIGEAPGALLTGHGIALTDSSLHGLVKRVYDLKLNASIQQHAIILGGDIEYLEGQNIEEPPPIVVPTDTGGGPGAARFWEYWSRQVSLD